MTSYRVQNWAGRLQAAEAGTRQVVTDPVRPGKRFSAEKRATVLAISLALAVSIFIISILIQDVSAIYQNNKNINRLTRKIETLESSVSDLHTQLDGKAIYLEALAELNQKKSPAVQISIP